MRMTRFEGFNLVLNGLARGKIFLQEFIFL